MLYYLQGIETVYSLYPVALHCFPRIRREHHYIRALYTALEIVRYGVQQGVVSAVSESVIAGDVYFVLLA